MMSTPGETPRRRKPIPGEPLEEPPAQTPPPVNGANGHPEEGGKRRLFVTTPLGSRPAAPIALADGQEALGPLQAALPPDWLSAAIPDGPWDQIDWTPLQSRRPIIIPGNSVLGATSAAKLETYLRSLGIQASVLGLPEGLPDGWRIDHGMPAAISLLPDPQLGRGPIRNLGSIFSAHDLGQCEFEPLEWIIQDWLPVGLTVLVGAPKCGKSWLALDFAIEIAAGRQVFGKLETKQCAVLYLALEDPHRRLKSRMDILLGGNDYARNLMMAIEWPSLNQGGLERLDAYLDQVPQTKLVIVDIWARIRGEPSSKNKSVYNIDYDDVKALHQLCNKRAVALLLIHHTRKQDASDIFDTISGSQGIAGAADSMMVLRRKRGEELGEFAVTGRDIQHDGTFAVRFDKGTSKWILLGEAKEVKREGDKERVFNVMLAATSPMRGQEIADETELALAVVRTCLTRLKKKGAVYQLDHGTWGIAGRPYDKPAKSDSD